MKEIADTPPNQIVYVDETGSDEYIDREYGRSKRGTQVIGVVSGRKFKRTSIVAGKMGRTLISPLSYSGTMTGVFFEEWFETRLIPALPAHSAIVMDNASFHRKKKLRAIVELYGHRLLFLPPYSPELNPIEKFWAWLKRKLREIISSFPSFDAALRAAFERW